MRRELLLRLLGSHGHCLGLLVAHLLPHLGHTPQAFLLHPLRHHQIIVLRLQSHTRSSCSSTRTHGRHLEQLVRTASAMRSETHRCHRGTAGHDTWLPLTLARPRQPQLLRIRRLFLGKTRHRILGCRRRSRKKHVGTVRLLKVGCRALGDKLTDGLEGGWTRWIEVRRCWVVLLLLL